MPLNELIELADARFSATFDDKMPLNELIELADARFSATFDDKAN